MLASAGGNVRRSLGCFSFCFCFCFPQGLGKGIGRIFEFEIPRRYAAVVGKARVCLSPVTPQTRCVMRERGWSSNTLSIQSADLGAVISSCARVVSSVGFGFSAPQEDLTRALLLKLRVRLPCKGLERAWSYRPYFTARAEPCAIMNRIDRHSYLIGLL